ncbi:MULTISPECIES: hypothetical protein [Methylocystis]|uniref:DUF1488 family protein n=1 Tax=Methylocystis iwaonis TaxID=2885079 RepID=A0ABN6VDC8_9HYPH|nr:MULTISPECIES: hypothetical protein [Methylocystis]MBL1258423.1 hypothetical protein [Methylocystis sp. Sn-Cys]MDJ0447056.1 hypothetical protein [Methylocystis sp. JR02]BDV33644.1 hypothetical protein SS37A_11730 [Methylocystis iwaonis]
MPLEHIDSEIVREDNGFSFSMRIRGAQQTVRVFISDDALEGDSALPDDDELRGQLDADRAALEAVASEKYARGQVAADGVVAITLSDVVKFID